MSKFKNETGGVLTVNDLMVTVGPGEKFDWPDHDPEVHGLPTGCTWLDPPKDVKAKAAPDTPGDTKPAGKSGSTAGQDKEAGK